MPDISEFQPPSDRAYRRIRHAAETYFSAKRDGARIYIHLNPRGLHIEGVIASLAYSHIISWLELEDCEIDPVEESIKLVIAQLQHALYAKAG